MRMSTPKSKYIWGTATVFFCSGTRKFAALYGHSPWFCMHQLAIPHSYFGLHIHRAASGTVWPEADFGSWRLWDTHTQWSDLEPQKGQLELRPAG